MRECPLSSSPSGHTPVPAIPARHFSVTRARERETGRSLPRAHDLRGPPTAHSLQWKPLFAQSPQSEDRSVSLARTGARRNSSNQETGNLEPKWCCASGPARRAQAPCEFAGVSVLLAEEHPLKLSRLRRRQSRLREYFHDLISELPLFRGKYRRVAVPTQTSANVLVDPRALTRDLICESVQVPDRAGNETLRRQSARPARVRRLLDKSFPTSPLVLLQQDVAKLGARTRLGATQEATPAWAGASCARPPRAPAPRSAGSSG